MLSLNVVLKLPTKEGLFSSRRVMFHVAVLTTPLPQRLAPCLNLSHKQPRSKERLWRIRFEQSSSVTELLRSCPLHTLRSSGCIRQTTWLTRSTVSWSVCQPWDGPRPRRRYALVTKRTTGLRKRLLFRLCRKT